GRERVGQALQFSAQSGSAQVESVGSKVGVKGPARVFLPLLPEPGDPGQKLDFFYLVLFYLKERLGKVDLLLPVCPGLEDRCQKLCSAPSQVGLFGDSLQGDDCPLVILYALEDLLVAV